MCKNCLLVVALLLVISSVFWPNPSAIEAADGVHGDPQARCKNCHSCEKPTHENPCLLKCERPKEVSGIPDSATHGPDVIFLDQLVGLYEPVYFPHKLHADMEKMGEGCAVCHHHNPPGRILACRECHGGPSNPANLGQPGLKGAYHRQCLGCHREWSHKTDCNVCHAKRSEIAGKIAAGTAIANASPGMQDTNFDIMGSLHPNIETPKKYVYKTPEVPDGPIVTFHHKEHTDLFGLKCVDCHRKESCARCHDPQSHPPHVRNDPHQDCEKCHDVADNCALCHVQEETKGFNHETRTGFPLKTFHQQLACAQCHKEGRPFKKLDPACQNCHGEGWIPKDFDHARAGVKLDETHQQADCKDCHTEGLGKPSTCSGCHDDGKAFPGSVPGAVVQPR